MEELDKATIQPTTQDSSDNIGKLYQDAKNRGVKASEEEFRAYIEGGDENRKKLFSDLKSRGMQADESTFLDYIGYGGKPKSRSSAEKKQQRPSYEDWYQTVPSDRNDTTSYNLRRAYELAPWEELEAWRTSSAEDLEAGKNHLRSAYENPKTGEYEFVKRKDHPTIQMELDEYDKDEEFKKRYRLDTSGDYYRYVPRVQGVPEAYQDIVSSVPQAVRGTMENFFRGIGEMTDTPEGRKKAAMELRNAADMAGKGKVRQRLLDEADALEHADDRMLSKKEMDMVNETLKRNEEKKKLEFVTESMTDYGDEYYKTKKDAQKLLDSQYKTIDGKVLAMGGKTGGFVNGSDIVKTATDLYDETEDGEAMNAKIEDAVQRDTWDFVESTLNSDDKELAGVARHYKEHAALEAEAAALEELSKSLEERSKTLDLHDKTAVDAFNAEVAAARKRDKALRERYEAIGHLKESGAVERFDQALNAYLTEGESATKSLLDEKNEAINSVYGDWIDRKSIPLKQKVAKKYTDEIIGRINKQRESVDIPSYMLNNPMGSPIGVSGANTESGALSMAAQYAKKAQDLISNDKDTLYANSLAKGAVDAVADMDFWTFGLNEAVRGFISKDIMDKVGEDMSGYDSLTEDEKLAFDAMQNYWQTAQLFKSSGWYNAGQTTANALPFIASMWGSGAIVDAIKGGAKGAERVALRQAAQQAERLGFKKAVGKGLKAVGNAALEGAVYATTTGLPHTVAGTLEYLMPESVAYFDLDEETLKVEGLKPSEESVGSAIWKGWYDQFVEGMSEAISTYGLEPLQSMAYAKVAAGITTRLGKEGNRAFRNIVRSAFTEGTTASKMFRNISDFPNEFTEEMFGGFMRCIGGTSTWDDEFNKETVAQTAYGLMPMQVIFGGMGAHNMRRHNQRMRQAQDYLDKFSPESRALYDKLSGMSTYEGQDLLDREIVAIQQEVESLKKAGKFDEAAQKKMAARMNAALVNKEQLYMDEYAATIKDEQKRNAFESATSNLNEDTGDLLIVEYDNGEGGKSRGYLISQEGEDGIVSDGRHRYKVKMSGVEITERHSMEEIEDVIAGGEAETQDGLVPNAMPRPVAGTDYVNDNGDAPVFEGGGTLHVDNVDEEGYVTFTIDGNQTTVSRRQFNELVQQGYNNMEYALADMEAYGKIGEGYARMTAHAATPEAVAPVGRDIRDARAALAEVVGEDRVRQFEDMEQADLARAYAEADKDTKQLMLDWIGIGGLGGNAFSQELDSRVEAAAKAQHKTIADFVRSTVKGNQRNVFNKRDEITLATLDDGTQVVVGANDGRQATVMDMAGNRQIIPADRITESHKANAMGESRQATRSVADQAYALQQAYDGLVFAPNTEYTVAVGDNGKEDKAIVVDTYIGTSESGNGVGMVRYATEYHVDDETGEMKPVERSVKEVTQREFRDMVEAAQRKAKGNQAAEAEQQEADADQGIVKEGQEVTVMAGNKPFTGRYVNMAGHHFVFGPDGTKQEFKSMDELKESMRQASAANESVLAQQRSAQIAEQSEMEKEYQRRFDEAKTPEEKAAVIQEFIDQIKTDETVVLTGGNMEDILRRNGVSARTIRDIKAKQAAVSSKGQSMGGFFLKGIRYIFADDIRSIDHARSTYVHERQHGITKNNVSLLNEVAGAASRDELLGYIHALCNSDAYDNADVDVLAEEFISMAMEVAYRSEDVDAALRQLGIANDTLIQTIKNLDNEQRRSDSLAKARRGGGANLHVGDNAETGGRPDGQNQGREPGQVEEQRLRTPRRGDSQVGGGSGEVKTPAQLLDELVGREGDNAANKLANTISAIQGSIATAEANLAEARQRRDNLPEPYNEETQAAMDAANEDITNLVNEIDNLNKKAATYMLMQREQEKRFNEWMNSMSENEAANYSITEADAERLDTEISLASEGATEDGQQIRYPVSSIFQGIGLECFDKEGNPMTDSEGNVIARIGGKVFDGHHLITAEEVAAMRGTWNTITKMALDTGYVKKDAVDILNQKYADIINSFLVVGLNENGGMENLIDRWMWLGETVFRTIAKNGDKQYSFSADITRLCKKNEQIIKSISAMQSRVGYGITPSQIIDIYTKTFDKGYQVPCPVCYVFNRYIRNGKYATAAIKGMERYGQHLPGGSEPWTAKQWKRELDRLTRKNETNKSNAKAIARAQKALDSIPDEVDKLGNMLMNDKTSLIRLTNQERNEINRRIEKLNEMYQAAMDLYANAAMSNWIKSFAIRSINGNWVLYDDAKLPTDMADFRDCSLDLRKTAVTIGKYPGVQRLRKSGGAAAGKEVTFASNNEIGEFLSGIGAGSPETAPNVFAEALNGDKKAVKKALDRLKNAYVYAQRQSLRGGQRMWSWSDNLENLMPDVAMNLMQLQLVGGALQSYSKQLEGINLVARMGGYVNGSLMAKDNGYRELTEDDIVMVDGKPTLKERIHETITERVIKDGVVKDVPRDRTLAEAGAPVIEIGGKYYTAIFDDVIGVDFYGRDGKKGLKQLNETLDKAGNIIVGMNDTHVRVCLADPRIFFCIPWHSSGASNHILQQMLNILGTDIENFVSTDYTKMQEEKNYTKKTDGKLPDVPKEVLALWEKAEAIAKENKWKSGIGTIPNSKNGKVSAKQLEYRALRAAIFDGSIWNNEELLKKANADEFLKQVMRKMQERGLTEMTNADNEFIYPYEYWDESSTYDNADINGRRYLEYCRRLGVKPKFSGKLDNGRWTDEGNFVDDQGYWKLLIDRRMYGVDGKFQDLTPIDASGFNTELVDPNHNRSEFYVTQVAEDESISDIVDEVVEEENERMGEQHAVNYEMPFDDALAGFYNAFGITPKDIEEEPDVEEEEEPSYSVTQGFGSAGTSLNQIPAGMRKIDWESGTTNVDIGGGRFDKSTEYLAEQGVENLVFDPFNRSAEHNQAVAERVRDERVDTATVNNVLNVIDSEESRANVILQAAKAIKPDGTAYFTIYEGDKSGVGRQTKKDSWQNNRATKDYIQEIENYFDDVTLKNGVIIAKKPKQTDEESVWDFDGTYSGNDIRYSVTAQPPFKVNGTIYQRDKKYGVGKSIGGRLYLHKDYADGVIPSELLEKAKAMLPDGFKYNALSWKKGQDEELRFDEAPDFDTAREPITGDYVTVNVKTGEVKQGHSDQIWHHKWQWVKPDYQGFDTQESYDWSRRWTEKIQHPSGWRERWNEALEEAGLPTEESPSYSVTPQQDADYMDAVNRGDMETAQRMVLEAAKAAMPNTKVVDENGNPKVVYHQTNSTIFVNKETGQEWEKLGWQEKEEWENRDDWNEYWEEKDFNTFDESRARRSVEIPGFFFAPEYDEYHGYGERTIEAFLNIQNPAINPDYTGLGLTDNAGAEIRDRLIAEGYDGIINTEGGDVYEYIAFKPNQIKSADPVTYDDQGNVIPLSERFNPNNDDIRYSIVNEQGELNYEELDNIIRGQQNELAGLSRIPEEAIGRSVETPAIAAEAIARGVRQANLAEVWGEDRAREHTRELIKQWARQSGHWYDEARLTDGATEGRGGTESRVFITNNGETVRKLTSPVFSKGDVEPYIESLHLFGNVFGESAYDIKGFGENEDGELCVVVEQPYIQGVRLSDSGITKSIDKIRDFMEGLGFKNVGVSMFENDKYRVEDVNRTNVIVDANGDFHVIDAYVSLADESLYKEEPMYSFIGRAGAQRLDMEERSMWRLANLSVARDMEGQGKDAKAIKLATGWERGKDGKWRYEIMEDDGMAMFNAMQEQLGKSNGGEVDMRLGDIIDGELTTAYPRLKDITIKVYPSERLNDGAFGSYSEDNNTIELAGKRPFDRVYTTLYHEIQHAIQGIEGFAYGGNPAYIAQLISDMSNNEKIWGYKLDLDRVAKEHPEHADNEAELFNDILDGLTEQQAVSQGRVPEEGLRKQAFKIYQGKLDGERYRKSYEKYYDKLREAGRTNFFEGTPYELYKRIAGEVEARNVQTRIFMTYDERLKQLASETEDVSREDQLVIMSGDPVLYSVSSADGMGEMSLKEMATNALLQMAEDNKEDLGAREDAVKAYSQLLKELVQQQKEMKRSSSRLSKAARRKVEGAAEGIANAQNEYDMEVARKAMRLAQMMMRYGRMDNFSRGEVSSLMTALRNSMGKNTQQQVEKMTDQLLKHHLKESEALFDRQRKTKGVKLKNGVETQAGLDKNGQMILKALNDSMGLTTVKFNDKLQEVYNDMGSDAEGTAKAAGLAYEGMLLAKEWKEQIEDSELEEADLLDEVNKRKEALEELEGRLFDRVETTDKNGKKRNRRVFKEGVTEEDKQLYRDLKDGLTMLEASVDDDIRTLRMERADAYARLSAKLGGVIDESRQAAKEWVQRERQRAQEIQHNANSDLDGKPNNEQHPKWRELSFGEKFDRSGLVQFLTAPTRNFNEYLRLFGDKSPEGMGYLWSRFMPQAAKARDEEFAHLRMNMDELNAKVEEITGEKSIDQLQAKMHRMATITVDYKDGDNVSPHAMTQGEALYIYMVNKMSDGAVKLRAMGISEEDVERITEELDPSLIRMADWIQEEFLPKTRERYNAVHERMFGAPMANIKDYFPLKISEGGRNDEVQLGAENNGELPSTITGAVIKRTHNIAPLDLKTDAFTCLVQHLMEMEHWAAYAELSRDLGTLLSYKRFRNRVSNMSSARLGGRKVEGKKESLWKNFETVCNIVCGSYRPEYSDVDKFIRNVAKGVTASKINLRVYTALKQLASAPAFWTRASVGDIAKNQFNPVTWPRTWKWAVDNLPGFAVRWQGRKAGNDLLDDTKEDWGSWHNAIIEQASRIGMTPNAFIDALTVCVGAKAVYDTSKRRYLEAGFSEEEAEQRALNDASVAYNESQQSQDPAFISIMQAHRTALNSWMSAFRNSSFSYGRLLQRALHNAKKMIGGGKEYEASSIEYLTKMGVRDGLTEEQAREYAEKAFARGKRRVIADLGMYGFAINFLWYLVPYLPYLIGGKDRKKKREMLVDAGRHGLIANIEYAPFGNVVGSMINNMADNGKDWTSYSYHMLPLASDIENTIRMFGYDETAAWSNVFGILLSTYTGWDINGIAGTAWRIVDSANGDPEVSIGTALLLMRIMQVPQSQLDQLFIDEVGLSAADAKRIPADELARRYAWYKLHGNAPLTWYMYDEDKKAKVEQKYVNRFFKEITNRIDAIDEEDLEYNFESDDEAVRGLVAKSVAEKSGVKDYAGRNPSKGWKEDTQEAHLQYKRRRTWDDLKGDNAIERAIVEAEEAEDTERLDALRNAKSKLSKIKRRLGAPKDQRDNEDLIMREYREKRNEILKDYNINVD